MPRSYQLHRIFHWPFACPLRLLFVSSSSASLAVKHGAPARRGVPSAIDGMVERGRGGGGARGMRIAFA